MQERARDTASSQARAEQPRLQGLRDVERWKEKIEIRLDNRQVAFLFFGSALIACLLFILGVVVGKRLESRGHATAPEIEDPLALLDRVAATVPTAPVARSLSNVAIGRAHAAARLEKSHRPEKVAPIETGKRKPEEAALAEVPTKLPPADQLESEKPEKLVAKLVAEAAGAKKPEIPSPAAAAAPKPAAPAVAAGPKAAPSPAAAAPKPAPPPVAPAPIPAAPVAATPVAAVPAKPVALPSTSSVRSVATPPPAAPTTAANPELLPPSTVAPSRATPPPAAGRARFMLQVGSFLDRAEAEAFASTFAAEKPTVVTSEIPGKGTWYRVRLGAFEAFDQAVQAKLAFERRYSKIALVVGPL